MNLFTTTNLRKGLVFFALLLFSFFTKAQTTTTYTNSGSGTWTCPAGVTSVTVECWGAGGSGGGASGNNPAAAGGGGGGGYAKSVVTVVPGTVYSYSVGAGGTAQAGGSATQANSGGATWFNTIATIFADGGKGGFGSISAIAGLGGAGGSLNIGTTTQTGGAGANGAAGGAGYGGGGGAGADGTNASPTCDASTSNGGTAGTNGGGSGGNGQTGNGVGGASSAYGGGGGGARRTFGTRSGAAGSDGALGLTYVCPAYSGVYTVGGAGSPNFANLTAAFTAISCGGFGGNISLVLQSGYVSTGETFPLSVPNNEGTYSLTIYPAASGLSITGSNATAILYMNGSTNVVVDGRVNQAGAANLVVSNTNTSGATIELINDATYNTIQYCDVQGVETQFNAGLGIPSNGIIYFSTAVSNGNSNNTITNCNIHAGATTPSGCIFSSGTTSYPNSNNTVSNCNIYDFYLANQAGAAGIDLEGGNTA